MLPPKEFLKRIKPFDLLTNDELEGIVRNLDVEAFGEGEIIFRGKPKKIYIVSLGTVSLYKDGEVVEEFERGDIFGLGLYENVRAIASTDVVCFTVKREIIEKIMVENAKFRHFFDKFAAKEYRGLTSLMRGENIEDLMLVKVSDVLTKKPVFCDPYTTVREAAIIMELNGVGSIVVVKSDMTPIGIFTNKDLRRFVIHGEKKEEKVSAYMSSPVITLEFDKPIFEAQRLMMSNRINHIVVTRYGKLYGVVSIKDIVSQFEPLTSISILHRKLNKATNLEEVKALHGAIMDAIKRLLKRGLHFYEISTLITDFYDLLTEKVISIVEESYEREFGSLGDYVWVNMGSSARKEQIIATDQDNAIIHEGGDFKEFARLVNDALEFVGIPKCSGGYMAVNWSLSLEDWKKKFSEWIVNFTPENIRHLTIFLDLRAIYGKKNLLKELFEALEQKLNMQILRQLVNDATMLEPPKIGGIRGSDEVDLKKFGIYPIVNCTRVLALEAGIFEIANTRERLLRLVEMKKIEEKIAKGIIECFEFLQDLRLRNQVEGKKNLIKIKEVSRIEFFIIKDVFRTIQEFQKYLKGRFVAWG